MKEKDIHGIADDVGYLYDRWQDERGMPGEEFVHYRNFAQKKVEARKAEFQSLEAEPFVLKFKKGKNEYVLTFKDKGTQIDTYKHL